jgi:nuclear transcription factor Y gamma
MEGQVVELTEAEQAQHQLQMEQQLKSFWAKQLLEMEQLEVGSEQGTARPEETE